jgi:hypothetical protein
VYRLFRCSLEVGCHFLTKPVAVSDQQIEVPIDLICEVPGEYSGPASRAYLYYNADLKHWVAPLKVSIAAKAE